MHICVACKHPRVWVDGVTRAGTYLPSPRLGHPADHDPTYNGEGFVPPPERAEFRCGYGEAYDTDPLTGHTVCTGPYCSEKNGIGDCADFEKRD